MNSYEIKYQQGGSTLKHISNVSLILMTENSEILFLQNRNNKLMLPGGKIENKDFINISSVSEILKKAMIREFIEETGQNIFIPKLKNDIFIYHQHTVIFKTIINNKIPPSFFRKNNEVINYYWIHKSMIFQQNLESYVRRSLQEMNFYLNTATKLNKNINYIKYLFITSTQMPKLYEITPNLGCYIKIDLTNDFNGCKYKSSCNRKRPFIKSFDQGCEINVTKTINFHKYKFAKIIKQNKTPHQHWHIDNYIWSNCLC